MDFFETDAGFLLYDGLLLASGLLLLVLAGFGIGSRAVNAIVGLLAFGYGVYLVTVFFNGGTFRIFLYAFILPIVAIYQLYKGLEERKKAKMVAAQPQPDFPAAPPAA